ncbi:MAG TPA: TlpA disulfide reductase family protein [Thermoanaerobaculia bacterium]|nr:TlpA disulfide reductase family protein [Thermoanaerobaculia bacterium]
MNRKVLIAGLLIIGPMLAILAANIGRDPHKVNSPMIGRTAPTFVLNDVTSGTEVSFDSLRGAPAVVNFWATWCVPCFAEHGVLQQAAQQYGDRVRFVSVVYDDEPGKIRDFLRDNGSSYPTLLDSAGKTAIAYGVYGVPETFFLDSKGVIVAKFEGPLSPDVIENNLRKANRGPL